jgi:hypothetical protein
MYRFKFKFDYVNPEKSWRSCLFFCPSDLSLAIETIISYKRYPLLDRPIGSPTQSQVRLFLLMAAGAFAGWPDLFLVREFFVVAFVAFDAASVVRRIVRVAMIGDFKVEFASGLAFKAFLEMALPAFLDRFIPGIFVRVMTFFAILRVGWLDMRRVIKFCRASFVS